MYFLKGIDGYHQLFEIPILPGLFVKVSLIELLRSIVSRYGDAINELKLTAIKQLH